MKKCHYVNDAFRRLYQRNHPKKEKSVLQKEGEKKLPEESLKVTKQFSNFDFSILPYTTPS